MSDVAQGFVCPLQGDCFDEAGLPYPTAAACHDAVARYRASPPGRERGEVACELYLRHLPLVRKTLARFCSRSECFPGLCLNEDLIGESFQTFLKALNEFDPDRGIDFLGYVSQRLVWGMEKAAGRELRDRQRLGNADGLERVPSPDGTEEDRVNAVLVEELLRQIGPQDSWLAVQHYGVGRPARELAGSLGVTPAAVRKRLERLRRRLRAFASGADDVT